MYTVDFNGRVTAYDYDNSATGGGRVEDVRYYNSAADYNANTNLVREISYAYDAYGRQVTVTDSAFSTPTTYTYDIYGHVIEIDSPQGSVHYAYDNLGQQIATWTGSAATLSDAGTSATTLTEYTYDQLGRLASTKATREFGANVGTLDSTAYNPDGTIDYEVTTTAGDDLVKAYSYNAFGRVSQIMYFDDANGNNVHDSGETVLQQFDYTYNKDNTRASEVDHEGSTLAATINWTYNGEGEVATEEFIGMDDAGNGIHYLDTYLYDLSGNRISLEHNHISGPTTSDGASYTTTSLYNADGQLLSETKNAGGSGNTFTAYGYTGTDQTSQIVYSGTSSGGSVITNTAYTYDVADELSEVSIATTGSGTQSVTYKYDATGDRVERTQNGTTTIYLIDPSNPTGYSQVIEEGTDANNDGMLEAGEITQTYLLGMTILSQTSSTGRALQLLTDAHGSTRNVINIAVGLTLLQRYAYTAYGEDQGLPTNPLTAVRYAGQMIDALTGLSFNRARWYDPSTGTFTTLDPEEGSSDSPLSFNHYLYGDGNPVINSDPSGRDSLPELLISTTTGETLDNLQNAYKAAKGEAEQAVLLVHIAMVEMLITSMASGALDTTELVFQAAYYTYMLWKFDERMKSQTQEFKLVADLPNLVKYIAALPDSGAELANNLPAVDGKAFTFLTSKTTVHLITFIPLTGSGVRDNLLAWGTWFAFDATQLLGAIRSGLNWVATAAADAESAIEGGKIGRLTDFGTLKSTFVANKSWHHSEIMGVMELILSSENYGKGSQTHVGGAQFWSILTGTPYDRSLPQDE